MGSTIPPPHHGVLNINGEGEPGDDELQFQYMQRGWVTGWETWDASPSGFQPQFTVPMGIAPDLYERYANIEPGTEVSTVGDGPRYVFVKGEGFVEVRDSPYFVDSPPTDWEEVSAAVEIETPTPPPIVFADIPVIDPTFDPTVTVGETSSGDSVAVEQERPVAFWDTVGDIFTTTAPGAINAYGQNQGWWGTPTAVAPQQLVLPQRPMEPFPQGIDMMGSGAQPGATTVQDPGTCPPPGARYLRYNCQTGALSKIPRRRRRRLLTSSDLKDLAALKAIVGGGAKMDGAIVAAVRR